MISEIRIEESVGFDTAVVSLELLESDAVGNGALNSISDRDQIIRRVPLEISPETRSTSLRESR